MVCTYMFTFMICLIQLMYPLRIVQKPLPIAAGLRAMGAHRRGADPRTSHLTILRNAYLYVYYIVVTLFGVG